MEFVFFIHHVIFRKINTVQIIPEPTNNINNQRYNPSLINNWEIIIIAIVANVIMVTVLLILFVGFFGNVAVLPIIAAINIAAMFFYFNGKLRKFYVRQFWDNAPNFLQYFNPDRIIEINNTDSSNIELGPLPKNRSYNKRF